MNVSGIQLRIRRVVSDRAHELNAAQLPEMVAKTLLRHLHGTPAQNEALGRTTTAEVVAMRVAQCISERLSPGSAIGKPPNGSEGGLS